MTIELLDLSIIPAEKVAAAFTMVAVPGPSGPIRYRAALGSGVGGGPGSDTTAARLVDPRFRGIQRIDLKATYGARCDGTSHPLGGIFGSLAIATAAYPNAGLTGANWAAMEIDTAAFLQAEYDIRTGSAGAGIIGLNDGAAMMVSQQLNIQDASRVWFHGGRGVTLLTAGCGTTPALRLANCPNVSLALADMQFLAKSTGVSVSSSSGGVAHTGFVTGAAFLQLDNVQGVDIERVGWNGYDSPILWGNHIYGIRFRQCGGTGCNIGWNWSQTVGLDSMERIYFEGGALANNNYGFYWDATYGPSKQYAQGGSVFIQDSAIDYNIVRQGVYLGAPVGNSYAGSSMHVTGCHIETTGACSGTARARILSQGTLLMSQNELYENDANVPAGFVEVADGTSCSMVNNRVNNTVMALMYSATGAAKRVAAFGNVMQDTFARPTMIVDANGPRMQPASDDNDSRLIFNDPNPMRAGTYYGATDILCDYFGGAEPLTLDDTGYPIGYTFRVWCLAAAVTIAVKAGTTLTSFPANAYLLTTPGTFAVVRRHSLTQWVVTGLGTGSSAAIATTSAAGLVKPDGTTLLVAGDGTVSVAGQALASLTQKTDSFGTDLIQINRGGVDYKQAVADFQAANQTTIHALAAGSGPVSGTEFAAYDVSGGATVKYTLAQIAASVAAINGGSSATAPGQVGSLAAGTPTSTTIPITYTAPSTGTAPITYAPSTAPHGTTTWTANAATFGATGGTLTGLSASTNYDVRIVATNSAGSSTTTLTIGVSTAASGPSYPAMAFTGSAAFESTSPIFGAKSLKGGAGSGTATFTIPENANGNSQSSIVIRGWFKAANATSSSDGTFLRLVFANGLDMRLATVGGQLAASTVGSSFVAVPISIRDGNVHFFDFRTDCNYNAAYSALYVDGTPVAVTNGAQPFPTSGSATLTFAGGSGLIATDLLDNIEISTDTASNGATVPSGAITRGPKTIVIYNFDAGDGTGS